MTRAKYSKTRDFFYSLSPWILAAACVLLFFVLTLFAFNNYQREKKLVIDALTQKGVTILRFIKSSSRESMRANFRGSQELLPWEDHARAAMQQAAEQPGVDYVVLVDIEDQVILGAGTELAEEAINIDNITFFSSLRGREPHYIVSRTVEGEEEKRRSFQVAGLFQSPGGSGPFPGMGMRPGGRRMMIHGPGRQPMLAYIKAEMDRLNKAHPILIVQLNLEQFTSPVKRQILQMVILLVVFILVAVGSFLSLLTLRGLKGSRVHLGRVEKELQRSERLAALGKMAAGVAHELRNPLSSIKGLAILLKSKFIDEEEGVETATLLVQEVTRLNRSIEELLDYAKPTKLNKIPINVNAIVKKTALLVEMDLEAQNISLCLKLAGTLPTIQADDDKLNQVFLNLFLNSIQAMDSGGILTISSHLKGKNVAVVVEDTGRGIEGENLQKAFDPYFTTKRDGTGLGLALSAKIIEEHEGEIVIASQPGEGTRVEVVLPVMAG